MQKKPLIVGESTPYGTDPEFVLHPYPPKASGDRLCRVIMGLRPSEYIKKFDRTNLCDGAFKMIPAKKEAERLVMEHNADQFVLLGAKVAAAFGLKYEPLAVKRPFMLGPDLLMLPHPGALNRIWNNPGYMEEVRCFLRMEGIL